MFILLSYVGLIIAIMRGFLTSEAVERAFEYEKVRGLSASIQIIYNYSAWTWCRSGRALASCAGDHERPRFESWVMPSTCLPSSEWVPL